MNRHGGVLLSHPGTGPFVQHSARALYEHGLLSTYATSFAYQPDSRLGWALRRGLGLFTSDPEKVLSRRRLTEVPDHLVASYPLPEVIRLAVAKSPFGVDVADSVWEQMEQWFDRTVAQQHVRGKGLAGVYGYEHATLTAFQTQKAEGGLCIYEMPITHHAATAQQLEPEYARFPEILSPAERRIRARAPRRNARKDAELQLADRVVVNSTFTKESLIAAGYPAAHISVIPLGAPAVTAPHAPLPQEGPFIFLSAGTQSVRKGVHYLLEAWRRIAPAPDVELWLIGEMQLPEHLLAKLPGTVIIRPSVPRSELFEIYRRANVLVFPSLAEGFGMVITEAMAHGLPIITTPHTAGPDILTAGHDGFIVPPRDVERLAEAMQWSLDHREQLAEMGQQAAQTAARWQWSDYRRAFGATITGFLAG